MNPDEQLIHDLCKDALSTCNSINANLTGLQRNLNIGMPVAEIMKLVGWDTHSLDVCVAALRKAIPEDEEVE